MLDAEKNKRTARLAGAWWMLFIMIAPFSYLYVDEKLLISGNAAATQSNINSNIALFWAGTVAFLAGYSCFILLAKTLCKLFVSVDYRLTRWMTGFVITGTAIVLMGKISEIIAANAGSLEDAACLFKLRPYIEMAGELFWGLWLIPLAMLIFKSDYVPKTIGVALLVAASYHLAAFGIFFTKGADVSAHPVLAALGIGELAMALWLLVMPFQLHFLTCILNFCLSKLKKYSCKP